MNNRYNEKVYAEEILDKGFLTKYKNYELRILVKYFKYLGDPPRVRKEKLYEFCEKHIKNFNRANSYKMINSVVNYSRKKENQLIVIESISVTKNELDKIHSFDLHDEYKKILFTLLVMNKLNHIIKSICLDGYAPNEHYFGGNEKKFKELKELAKIDGFLIKHKLKIHNIIFELNQKGIVESKSKGKIKLSYLYDIPHDDEIVISIEHFDSIGHYYDLHMGENRVKECEECGKPIKMKSNKTKYCNHCAKENWKNYNAQKQREYRENK